MGKYDPLGSFLRARSTSEVPMSFAEIEQIIGAQLPAAADRHPAFWSNNPSNNVMTKVWLDAGFRTERVDLGGRRLVFRRASHATSGAAPRERGVLSAVQRALGGTVRIADGFDLTTPAHEPWGAEAE